jgi:hypothetical protein
LLLPYPQFSSVTLTESTGYSLYNALSVKVQKRATKDLTLLFGYTWSSNWDNLYSGGDSLNSTNGPANNHNMKGEYARAVNDIPNRYTAAITYQMPVGRGRQLFGNAPRIVDMLIGGYDINAVISRQDGGPHSITQSTDYSSTYGSSEFDGQVRPTLVPGINPCRSGTPESRGGTNGTPIYFNAAAFTGTPAFHYGTQPRTLPCKGPGLSNTDLSINKTFSFGERGEKVQFRAEALNVTNTPQFSIASVALSASQTTKTPTGAVTLTPSTTTGTLSQKNYNRLIQLGGRITF